MLQLLGTELRDLGAQRGLVLAEGGLLRLVVLVDRLLHRDGAGHGAAVAEQGGGGAQREAGDMPDRQQRGRADPARGDQPGEGVEVHLLLVLHVPDHRLPLGAAEHRELAGVDPLGAVFAGVVDPDGLLDHPAGGLAPHARAPLRIQMAANAERPSA